MKRSFDVATGILRSRHRNKLNNGLLDLKFDEVVTANGFKENIVDQCIYMKVGGNKYIFLVLYVDDILLATNDTDLLVETKQILFSHF